MRGKTSRRVAAGAALAGLALLACEAVVPAADIPERIETIPQLDVVLIVIDTLRADWTTPYGFEKDTTPELASWAQRGVLFEQARAQSSWTKISMASMLTSLWPRSHGIREAQDGLAEGAQTLAEVLQQAGYQTFAVQTNGWLHQSFGFHQGFDRYLFPAGASGKIAPHEKPSLWTHADRVVEEAEHLIQTRDPDRPMFLYVHLMDVHEFAAPPEFQVYGNDTAAMYQAAVRWSDDALRRIREALDAAGTLDRSVVVLASDHGETFGEHGIHGHARNVLTPSIHVPLVFRLPFAVAPLRIKSQVRNLDLAPTLLELAGVPSPSRFEGTSLLPLITSSSQGEDRPSYAALGFTLFRDASVQDALTTGDWTYARNAPAKENEPDDYTSRAVAPGGEFLFDRSVDPGEKVNLIELEGARAAAMRGELEKHLAEAELNDVKDEGVRIDPAIAGRLRAMGYLR
ncbi:MAG: sulfatase [Deltaproteobacteria bacterium]|nr:sulfatase [Deltaproteobacteria bacterium]MBW2393071.1 sulfatase [Deltaproteobacteria bacterium]